MTPTEVQALLDQLPVAACVMEGWRIRAANARMEDLTGYSRAELLDEKSPLFALVAPEDRERIKALREARLRGEPAPDEYDFAGTGARGRRVPVRVRIAPFPAAGPSAQLFVFSDERVRARSAALIRGFVDVAIAAQQERTQADFFRAVRDKLLSLGLNSTVLELDGDRFRFPSFVPPRTPVGVEMRERLSGWIPVSRMSVDITKAEGTLVDDLPRFLADLVGVDQTVYRGRLPSRGVVATIRVAGEPRYALSASGDDFDHAVAGAFGLLGRQLGAALETTRRLEELDRRNSELSLLLELGREVVGVLDPKQVLQAAAQTAARVLRCSSAYVLVPNEKGTALCIAAREDPEQSPETAVGTELPLPKGSLSALAYSTLQPCSSTDNQRDPRVDPEVARRFGCRATLAVPLLSQGRARGVLSLFERNLRHFDDQDLRVASHTAQLVAAGLDNARLYAEQRNRAEEMAQLNEVARRLAGSLEARRLLELGGETLAQLLDAELWFMLVPEAETQRLRFAAVHPAHSGMLGEVLLLDETSMAATAYRTRKVVQLTDPLSAPATASRTLALQLGNRTTLAAPLIARDQVLGVAVVLGRAGMAAFSQADMDRALAVAGQLALALLSARLYEDLRNSYAELARTQNELIDRERLAALGELSASIAHEVRNPLGVIFNSVGSLRRLLKPAGDVALLLDIVGEEADRLNRMVGDLLDYSRPVRPALMPVPIGPLVAEALSAAKLQVGPSADQVKVQVRVAPDAATVRADARLLRQALVNLFLNAYQAMPRSGRLEVRAARVQSGAAAWADIAIEDSGPGISPELREKVFQPFFTTKPTGTGLGLAVVRRIVEGHGGVVELARSASGTAFHVRLPLDG